MKPHTFVGKSCMWCNANNGFPALEEDGTPRSGCWYPRDIQFIKDELRKPHGVRFSEDEIADAIAWHLEVYPVSNMS